MSVEDDHVSVFVDNQQLSYYNGELFGKIDNVGAIDISDTETRLLRQADDGASIEVFD